MLLRRSQITAIGTGSRSSTSRSRHVPNTGYSAARLSVSGPTASVSTSASEPPKPGKCWLVGAGPGPADYLTMKAVRLLQTADVVVYDDLGSQDSLGLVPPSAELVYVGKRGGRESIKQPQINELLVAKCVEMAALQAAGIPYELVPGVSSALAAPLFAGFPLTHATLSPSFTVLSGHDPDSTDWDALDPGLGAGGGGGGGADSPTRTLVVLMAGRALGDIAGRLRDTGWPDDTPVVVVRAAGLPEQKVWYSRLDSVKKNTEDAGSLSPCVVVIGRVAGTQRQLTPNLAQLEFAAPHVPAMAVACRAAPGVPSATPVTTSSTTATSTSLPNGTSALPSPDDQRTPSASSPKLPTPESTLQYQEQSAQSQQPQPPSSSSPPPPPPPEEDAAWRASAEERVRRLNTLVETRRLYRNIVRAEYLLNLGSPLYTPPPPPPPATAESAEESATSGSSGGVAAVGAVGGWSDVDADRVASAGSYSSSSNSSSLSLTLPTSPSPSRGPEEDKALKAALDSVAEMALVLEQLKASLRSLPAGFGAAIFPASTSSTSEETVREVARQLVAGLRERLAAELPLLPISSDAAIHYIETRNAKFSRRVALDELQGGSGGGAGSGSSGAATNAGGMGGGSTGSIAGNSIAGGGGSGGGVAADLGVGGGSAVRATPLERLEAAERVAGEIIANRIKPALKRASEQDLVQVVRGTGSYLKGLWVRLNGGSPAAGRWGGWMGAVGALEGRELPRPEGAQQRSELAISRLSLDLEALEKRLQEASKKRENKLRKAGLQGRVQMAIQLKGLDAEVLHLSSLLAVRTLQLEMEHVYGSLEAEALDVFNGLQPGGLLARDGSTNELALLVAEFALLDEQLTLLAAALEGGTAAAAAAAGGAAEEGAAAAAGGSGSAPAGGSATAATAAAAAAAAAMGPALVNDDVLSKLALEIPDMRSRVGVADQVVFGGQGFSLTKARLQIGESLDKVREAVTFLTRGFKLLGSDIATGARLFVKAALGNTLKPREVSALRRTARDLLTFIPFTIILIIPLSPLGHVLVFGFIQRYFPSFFPSQFSTRRQEIMVRYEELERQLLEAQAAVEEAEEEVELARAREAVARLTAPEPPASVAAAVRILAEQLDEIRDDVHLVDPLVEGAGGEAAHGADGSGGGAHGKTRFH
ncbi:hypothetical protein VOLCADRAFT_104902 [Volvox carteri f. nagariensis]|uniref:uroporphyrinogen-III C-methyltransferase n=1 Tax=Volvox carteri f. nagariensis TaxID=3068 RepID=D8TWW9_VOLCA|nr:uncharacterized protein VOLCADRAFT_104902 [Volvox carteri f. nagariensis]EFJ48119.1 hypothetical protein VOLCADRAFT_104902 [Volvox carteri f. nagariensis]|eukprot:XP_002950804.1 hypothetical protein VOLCADRAFT_104902 [Volvox carteri f. nagariensis]